MFLLGSRSSLRLVQTAIEDLVLAVGSLRLRQSFLGLDPAAVPCFPPTGPGGVTTQERIGVVTSSPLPPLRTAASMVACTNAIVGGVTVALAVRSLVDASVPAAAVTAALATLAFAAFWLRLPGPTRPAGRGGGPGAVQGQGPDLPG